MKLKFIIIPIVILLVIYVAFAQTTFVIGTLSMNISIGDSFKIFVDTTNNRVGIGNSIPNNTLDVSGDVNITGNLSVANKMTGVDFQRFDTVGESTWTKPASATIVKIELIGAGGGGGGGNSGGISDNDRGGGGGGGGAV